MIYIDPSGHESLLVAIDGTDSESWRKRSKTTGRTNSHVRNFYEDYVMSAGDSKLYLHGPNAKITGADCRNIHDKAMSWINERLSKNSSQQVNLVGHSRGGYIAMEVARELVENGVRVNYLGLYDPVDMAPGYGKKETVPAVDFAVRVMAMPGVGSRLYFNTADGGFEGSSRNEAYSDAYVKATHGGIGGDSWEGDRVVPTLFGMTKEKDISGSINADLTVRRKAKQAGIWLVPPSF